MNRFLWPCLLLIFSVVFSFLLFFLAPLTDSFAHSLGCQVSIATIDHTPTQPEPCYWLGHNIGGVLESLEEQGLFFAFVAIPLGLLLALASAVWLWVVTLSAQDRV